MANLYVRTEDIREEDILDIFVETKKDRDIIESLKSHEPVVLEGSRGVGKSFLFKVAKTELENNFGQKGVLPVYVTFNKSSLIKTSDDRQFTHWMTARICSQIVRALQRHGQLARRPTSVPVLTGDEEINSDKTRVERIAEAYEDSWYDTPEDIDHHVLPNPTQLKDAIEDICRDLDAVSSVNILIDEAAHVFIPEQQRQFFTLFRDLRSPYLTCNAAVYPGVTAYGSSFQPTHDASMQTLVRDPMSDNYISNMKEMVTKQIDNEDLLQSIAHRGENFSILAYASSGNPRTLIKTFRQGGLSSRDLNEITREYYRTDVWSEHSDLSDKYPGHRPLIDWGRNFMEDEVLPELKSKNDRYIEKDKKTTAFFWIHRDAPQQVKEALRLLAYTGVVRVHSEGIKATRSRIGTRYMVNLGCLFALESKPASTAHDIATRLTPKRMSEYGQNHPSYEPLLDELPNFDELDTSDALDSQIQKNVDVLDLTSFKKESLHKLDLDTIGDVLKATESDLKQAHYVGDKRSRRIKNTAFTAVLEYLSG